MNSRLFAIVERGRVANIAIAEDARVFGAVAVDLTDRANRPAIGWLYDAATDVFAEAPYVAPPVFSRSAATIKAEAIATVNRLAGECRARYITVVSGQPETYWLKADELDAYDAVMATSGDVVPAAYPILSAEATATGATLADLATLVRTTRVKWIQLAAVVEGMRRGAIVTIGRATTEAEVQAAIPLTWP